MKIQIEKFITRQMLKDNPKSLFIFGDNLQRKGMGGQAKEMRGEPNAIGIVTKISTSSYMKDVDYEANRRLINCDFQRLWRELHKYDTLVVPENGIGTGLAQMQMKCPKTFGFLIRKLNQTLVLWRDDSWCRVKKDGTITDVRP